ncbi:hypothetical protein [Prochlorococcus marinus]|uniref:Uncharacterized protein n=1 Tax=Prochlorococcus marinus XMU1408 TaxID=2213228 RepID=A0A318R6B6_PROMR|nr:hypothetical protein [Prochlorococcus marinus]MBW3041977.1 hypothetical protein [Prochlorococcus marinus str. XMU1408]PYE03102.1 hypothetical protein DNJ73_05005 [Prochlorococcus marinus XMU1408]
MSKTRLIGTVEVTINDILNRLSKLDGEDKQSLQEEFKEWIEAVGDDTNNYDVLFINRISN